MADQLTDAELDAAIAKAGSADALAARAKLRANEATKEFFLRHLVDNTTSPPTLAVRLVVTDWRALDLFFVSPVTTEFDPQKIHQELIRGIAESVKNRQAIQLLYYLLLFAKAMRPPAV